jgi:hypothetical protein
MASKAECVKVIKEATGVSENDARELLDQVTKEKERLRALGKIADADKELGKWAKDHAQEMKIQAAMQRKQTALNILHRKELDTFLERFESETKGRSDEGFMAILVGSFKKVFGARNSISAKRLALTDQWLGGITKELSERPEVIELLRKDKKFLDDIVREMYEIREGGKPGISKNADAKFVADIFSRYTEEARLRLNDAGANIGKIGGWTPQNHDAAKLLKVGKEKWTDFIMSRLDHERSFEGATPDEIKKILGETFENIVTGRDRAITAREKGEYIGPRNLASSMGKHRELHFLNADAWLQYQAEFGQGNIFTNIGSHLDKAARKLAIMETLGPNPETMLGSLLENARRRIRENPSLTPEQKAKQLAKLNTDLGKRTGKIGKAFAEIMGETQIRENITGAKIASGIRAIESMAKLGGALLSQLSDLMTFAANARFNGMNLFEAYGHAFTTLMEGRGTKEQQQIAHALGTLYDGMLGDITSRWNAQDSMPGKLSNLMNTFFKWSGMSWWTDVMKSGYSRMLSSHLAENAIHAWDDLDIRIQKVFEHHGLSEKHWDAIRSIVSDEADGRRYLLPENIRKVDDHLIDAMNEEQITKMREAMKLDESKNPEVNAERQEKFQESLDRLRERTRRDLETDFMAFIADETRHAVIEPDDRARAFITQGTRPGTLLGEAVRFVMQFKSFPVAYYQSMLQGGRFNAPGRAIDLPGITHMVAASLILGYASSTAKDLAKGRTPKDPRNWETWLAAAVQSGGAGIYGDFLLSKYNRFGGGPIDTLAGPAAGAAGEAIQIGSGLIHGTADKADAVRLLMDNTPFINLWYTRAALDYAILFHVREMLSPGTLAKTERRMKEEYNQKYILPPSSVIKRGGGFK